MQAFARSLSIDGERAIIPASALSLSGFRSWVKSSQFPEKLQAAFILGEVLIDMSPEATETHNKVKQEITVVLAQLVKREDLGESYADGVLVTNEEAELSTEPDFVFVSWDGFQEGRARLLAKANRDDDFVEIEGAPDLVVEIVSDSSVRKDLRLLRTAYQRARVPEYWLIDARGVEVAFEILHYGPAGYVPSVPSGAVQASRVFGRKFVLDRS
jgi:Uma2 family endonuclease